MSAPAVEAVFERATAIVDAVLWKRDLDRRSATDDRRCFQRGVLGPAEDPAISASVLVEPTVDTVHVRVRFLHLHRRDDGWDEAVAVDHDEILDLRHGTAWPTTTPIDVAAGTGGRPLHGTLTASYIPDGGLIRLTATVENSATAATGARADALLDSFIGCHLLFSSERDAFVSLQEPPEHAVATAERCSQHRCWPVLVGPQPRRDLVLASPVILDDYPTVPPQRAGFDDTEIDEMPALRLRIDDRDDTARPQATDQRTAAIFRPTRKVLVAGVGNLFRSDDGFGSAVAARLLEGPVPDGATVVDYGIRGVHLAFDLADGVDTLILVDTVPNAGDPGAVSILEVPAGAFATAAFDAHDLDPNLVFRSLGALVEAPPRTFVVGCQPLSVEDGIGLSDPVAAAVPIAADMVLQLLRQRLGVTG